MSTDLVPHNPASTALSTDSWRDLTDLAGKLSRSGLIPGPLRMKPDDVLVVLLSGRELGIPPMLALRSIHVIDGKPVLSADLAAALVLRSPVCGEFRCVEASENQSVYKARRSTETEASTYVFSMEDAKRANLAGRQNWRNFPKAMLRARCCMMAARAHFPDLVASVYETDEIERPEAAPAEEKPVTAIAAFKAKHREATPVPPPETAAAFDAQAQAIADQAPPPAEPKAEPEREPGADAEEDAPKEPEVAPDEWRLIADDLIARLAEVKHAKHLTNHKRKHAAEYAALKANAPAEFARAVAAGKAAAERT